MKEMKDEVRPPKEGEYVAFLGLVYQVKRVQVKMGRVKGVLCKPMCTLVEFQKEVMARRQLEQFSKMMQAQQAAPREAGEADVVAALGG